MATIKHVNGERVPINDTIAEGLVELAEYCKSRTCCVNCSFEVAPHVCIINYNRDQIIKAIETGTRTTDDPPKGKQVFLKFRNPGDATITIYAVEDVKETEDFFVIETFDGVSFYRRDSVEMLAFGACLPPNL